MWLYTPDQVEEGEGMEAEQWTHDQTVCCTPAKHAVPTQTQRRRKRIKCSKKGPAPRLVLTQDFPTLFLARVKIHCSWIWETGLQEGNHSKKKVPSFVNLTDPLVPEGGRNWSCLNRTCFDIDGAPLSQFFCSRVWTQTSPLWTNEVDKWYSPSAASPSWNRAPSQLCWWD